MIYFVRASDGVGSIKIGTTIRLSSRLKQLEYEYGVSLQVLGVMDGSYADESALHKRFSCEKNEWFHADTDLLEFIATECRPWDGVDEVPPSKTTPVRITDEAIKWSRIASGYTGESVAEYVSRVLVERGQEDAERLHARVRVEKSAKPKGSTKP